MGTITQNTDGYPSVKLHCQRMMWPKRCIFGRKIENDIAPERYLAADPQIFLFSRLVIR
jgi:hypothetical protein